MYITSMCYVAVTVPLIGASSRYRGGSSELNRRFLGLQHQHRLLTLVLITDDVFAASGAKRLHTFILLQKCRDYWIPINVFNLVLCFNSVSR